MILLFHGVAFTWSAGLWLGVCRGRDVTSGFYQTAYLAALCGPSLSGLFCAWVERGWAGVRHLLGSLLRWKVPCRAWLAALLIPPLAMLAAAWLAQVLFHENITWVQPSVSSVIASFLTVLWRFGPLNEELGWRGYLLPRLLKHHPPLRATLMLAPAWALWHLPLWSLEDSGHHLWPFAYFLGIILPVSGLFTWIHLRARGSLLPAILFHTALNTSANFIPIVPPTHPSLVPFACWIGVMTLVWMLVSQSGKTPSAAVS